jgi:hypothetical protein
MSGHNEKVWSYDSMGMSLYTRSNIHDDATITVVDEDDVGVIPPSIVYVDMGNDGIYIGEPPYPTEPGAEIPVKIVMWIPDRPDDFYPLSFEFNDVGISPSSFSFDVESGVDQCDYMFPHRNGGWFMPYSGYSSNIIGTLTVPSSLGPGVHSIQFRVHWETCNGQEDCDGNGDDGWTDWVTVQIDIPDDELPDLICEIEPIAYVDGINPGLNPFAPGQGVEEWQVTVTNIGTDDFVIPGVDSAACSMLAFNSYSSDGTGSHDPFYYEWLLSPPGSIAPSESLTFDIDGTAICVDETGQIEAEAWMNFLWWWFPECIPFTPEESNMFNNYCNWAAPCGPPDSIEECEIIPSLVTNPDSEEVLTFDLYCDGLPCTGTVTWSTTPTGDTIGTMTANDSNGSTV